MNVIDHCLKYRKLIHQATGELPTEIILDENQITELLGREELLGSLGAPRPPMTEVTTETEEGLFGSKSTTRKVYDHKNPQYLMALEDHKAASAKFAKDFPNGKIFDMKVCLLSN